MSSTAHSPSHPGQPSLGGLMSRILLILVLWAGLVFVMLHYVGYVWPKAYQVSQAVQEQEDEKAKAVNAPAPAVAKPVASGASAPAASVSMTVPASSSTPAVKTAASPATTPAAASTPAAPAASAPATSVAGAAASTAAPATSAGTAAPGTATPAGSAAAKPAAGTAEQKLPFDVRLAGYDRSAFGNVSIFYSIVISVFCIGAIIIQIFKYKHVEEDPAH